MKSATFTITSTQCGQVLLPCPYTGRASDKGSHSVAVFDGEGGTNCAVHVAVSGNWLQCWSLTNVLPGYWCNLTNDQEERLICLIERFHRGEFGGSDLASEIAEVLTEEPDVEPIFGIYAPQSSSLLPIPTPQDASQSLPRPWTAKEIIHRAG